MIDYGYEEDNDDEEEDEKADEVEEEQGATKEIGTQMEDEIADALKGLGLNINEDGGMEVMMMMMMMDDWDRRMVSLRVKRKIIADTHHCSVLSVVPQIQTTVLAICGWAIMSYGTQPFTPQNHTHGTNCQRNKDVLFCCI